jgi:hypothetical protein
MKPGQFFVASWNNSTRLFRFVGPNKKGYALWVNYDATNQRWGNSLLNDGERFKDGADLSNDDWITKVLSDEEAQRTNGD